MKLKKLRPDEVESTPQRRDIEEAVAVLRAPLPSDEKELSREIDERADRVGEILARRRALLFG